MSFTFILTDRSNRYRELLTIQAETKKDGVKLAKIEASKSRNVLIY